MAARVQDLAQLIVDQYDGDAARVWWSAGTVAELLKRVGALPGFGEQKAKIFVALLGKQLGIQPTGWREAAGSFGAEGSHMSVADIFDAESLAQVRSDQQGLKGSHQGQGHVGPGTGLTLDAGEQHGGTVVVADLAGAAQLEQPGQAC